MSEMEDHIVTPSAHTLFVHITTASGTSVVDEAISADATNGGREWHLKTVERVTLAPDLTICEEVMLAGHPVRTFQEYLYATPEDEEEETPPRRPPSSAFDHVSSEKWFVAGHVGGDEARLQRLAAFDNIEIWPEHVSDVPTNPNVYRNIVSSLVTNVADADGNGVHSANSPLLDKLRLGNVILELRQQGDTREMREAVAASVRLLKQVADAQSIEMVVLAAKHPGAGGEVFDPQTRHMMVATASSDFAVRHYSELDTVVCLAKHLAAYKSGTEPSLMPVFSTQFESCQEETGGVSVCVRVNHNSASVYHFDDANDLAVEFAIGQTEELEVAVRNSSNALEYVIHNNALAVAEMQTPAEVGGVNIETDFFKALPQACGSVVLKLPGPPPSPTAAGAAPTVAAPVAVAAAPAAEEEVDNSATLEEELKLARAQIACLENERSGANADLETCREDVSALRSFSGQANQAVRLSLIRRTHEVQRMKAQMKQMQQAVVTAPRAAAALSPPPQKPAPEEPAEPAAVVDEEVKASKKSKLLEGVGNSLAMLRGAAGRLLTLPRRAASIAAPAVAVKTTAAPPTTTAATRRAPSKRQALMRYVATM